MALEAVIARRYVRAFAELVEELELTQAVQADMERLEAIADDPGSGLVGTLSNPVFTIAERQRALSAVLVRLEVQPVLASFLRLLLDKNRFAWLPQIIDGWRERIDRQTGRVRGTITTAQAMPAPLLREIQDSLSRAAGRQVVLTSQQDPSLLAGMVVELAGTVYDASLRSRLTGIEQALLNTHSTESPDV